MALPKPTVHGLVQTLLGEGYLGQDEQTRQYTVGLRVIEMGSIFAGNLKINQVGGELVQRMAAKCQQHARIAIWDNDTVLVTFNAFPSVESMVFQQVGPRVPGYCTSLGKAVLSSLDEAELAEYLDRTELIRYTQTTITDRQQLCDGLKKMAEQGYVTENGEFLMGTCCVGVPIFDESFKAIGSISLSGTPDILSEKQLSIVVPAIIQTGLEVSRRMGFHPEALPSRRQVAGR